jgi:hypothetical protein
MLIAILIIVGYVCAYLAGRVSMDLEHIGRRKKALMELNKLMMSLEAGKVTDTYNLNDLKNLGKSEGYLECLKIVSGQKLDAKKTKLESTHKKPVSKVSP